MKKLRVYNKETIEGQYPNGLAYSVPGEYGPGQNSFYVHGYIKKRITPKIDFEKTSYM